jgi:hypothetical protein
MLRSTRAQCILPLLLSISLSQALHIISPDTCSIPYLVPLNFQRACDKSDEYFRQDITIATSTDAENVISFTTPPNDTSSANLRSQPNIWTHEPFCLESIEAQNGFCVYTDAKFARGRGISFVATPYSMSDVLTAAVFKKHEEKLVQVSAEGAEKYFRKPVSGEKRFEMIANATFHWGDHVHSFTPVLAIQDPIMTYMTPEDQTLMLRVAIDRLPKKSQELFMSQFAVDGLDPYIDKMDKNGFNAQFGKSRHFFSAALPESAVSIIENPLLPIRGLMSIDVQP